MIGFTVSFAQQVTQQQKTVTGTIKDATGEALIGASVIVKNQPGLGTISDVMDISLSKQIIMTFL